MEDRTARDTDVIRRVLEGESERFDELVGAYQGLVAGIAWRHGVRRDEIEDVVSIVFYKAYANLHRYRPDHPFSTWLYRLAANAVVDHLRRRTRREAGRVEMPESVADGAAGPAADAEDRERAAAVRSALAQLSRPYREALELVYFEGLTVEQAARVLGVPTGTLKTRLMRGRDGMRRQLRAVLEGGVGGCDAL